MFSRFKKPEAAAAQGNNAQPQAARPAPQAAPAKPATGMRPMLSLIHI